MRKSILEMPEGASRDRSAPFLYMFLRATADTYTTGGVCMRREERPTRHPEGSFYDVEKLASVSEMTGLEPAAVDDEASAEAYEELWPMHRQKPVDCDRKG